MKAAFQRHLSLFLFIVCYLWIYGYALGLEGYIEVKEDDWEEAMIDWISCNASLGKHCKLEDKLSFGIFIILLFNFSGNYLFIFFLV